jgi:hypothetical protein
MTLDELQKQALTLTEYARLFLSSKVIDGG